MVIRRRWILLGTCIVGLALLVSPRLWSRPVATAVDPFCVLIALPTNSFTSVPDPAELGRRDLFGAANATINVTYGSGFTAFPNAQAAFQHAVDIWKTQVTSLVPIAVQADFSANLGSGVLGSAGFTWFARSFTNAPVANTWFPGPIVNALTGSAGFFSPDISANFSSTFSNWYFGTDGLTPAGKYDFVSVVLHELGHGLGFAGSMSDTGGVGSWGYTSGQTDQTYPLIYDRFVANGSGQSLIDTTLFANDSLALGTQLTSNNVYWNGARAVALNRNVPPRLYAPATWSSGSSIAHLDDATYPAGDINSLMTHAIGMAEAIHDPGPIMRGMLQDSGWTLALGCTYALSASAATIAQAGGTGMASVTPSSSTCGWTATSNASWITVTAGGSGTGAGTVTYSVAANSGPTRTGTLTIAGATLTVTQGPAMTVDHRTLAFGATNTSGTLSNVTASQRETVTFTGSTPTWTATTTEPWLQITGGSGTGTGQFTVAVVSAAGLPATGTTTGTVLVSSGGAVNSPIQVTVTLTLFASSTTSTAPFGSFDTPVNGATGLSGSIAVTGWALDDVGIDHVEIWRDVVAGETTPPYGGPGPGRGKIFIANPLFISGSRPDVEAAWPNSPLAYRSGWGYLLLTWGLWNQGNGAYTLYAFAYDKEGHASTLGTKTIAVDNQHATKPFGALDTPDYGATISGGFWNYGWTLTPTASPSCTIANGNVLVAIDSGPLVPVSYGDVRSDIASAFRGFTNGSSAGGAFYIDTTTLTNGTHQIGWFVTDSCGRQDGIGSRFFTVLNGSSLTTKAAAQSRPPQVASRAAQVAAGANWAPIEVQRSDGARTWAYPNAAGTRIVQIDQGERVEVQLPTIDSVTYAGYHWVNGQLRPPPLGSSLDTHAGLFYWQPAAGFLGSYDLVFVPTRLFSGASEGGQADRGPSVPVRIIVGPSVRMAIDTPYAGSTPSSPLVIAGWAIDLAAADRSGVDTVHVWAYPTAGGEPIFLGVAAYGDPRPDVGAIYGPQFENAAYNLTVGRLKPGTYDIVVYPHRVATGAFDGAQVVRISVP